jgi:hypothetical protein
MSLKLQFRAVRYGPADRASSRSHGGIKLWRACEVLGMDASVTLELIRTREAFSATGVETWKWTFTGILSSACCVLDNSRVRI